MQLRVFATCALLAGLVTPGVFLLLGRNEPWERWKVVCGAYVCISMLALWQCWTQPPFTRFVVYWGAATLVCPLAFGFFLVMFLMR